MLDSIDGRIFAWDTSTHSWSTFLAEAGQLESASQIEFGDDGRVFVSQTLNNQPRIVAFQLYHSGDWAGGLDPDSAELIGNYSNQSGATGIRIGPDGRLYANAFNAGEVWRSNPGISAMESEAFLVNLDLPASILFIFNLSDLIFADQFEAEPIPTSKSKSCLGCPLPETRPGPAD